MAQIWIVDRKFKNEKIDISLCYNFCILSISQLYDANESTGECKKRLDVS